MKKIVLFIILVMAIILPSIAQEPESGFNNTNNENIMLRIRKNNDEKDIVHRAPMRINIDAYYEVDSHTVNICYEGEAMGEVYLYLDDTLIGYDSDINTSLTIPGTPGSYRIEIITETWIAQGYLQL